MLSLFVANAKANHEKKRNLEGEIEKYFKGKKYRIVSSFFNGQPYGRSAKSWFGKEFKFDSGYIFIHDGKILIQPPGARSCLPIEQVEILGE